MFSLPVISNRAIRNGATAAIAVNQKPSRKRPRILAIIADAPAPSTWNPARGLISSDLSLVFQRQPDLVQPFQQTLASERVYIKLEQKIRIVAHRLALEIDRQRVSGPGSHSPEDLFDLRLGQSHRKQPVLETVVEKDVRKRRSDDRSKPMVVKRPRRVLPRSAAS